MVVILFHAKCYSFKTTQPTTPQEMRTLFKMKTLDLTFQESGDNTVDVEFVCLPHLAPLPEHFILHAPALRGDINVFYLVRPGPSSFAFFSRKSVGSRKFFGPKGQKKILGGKFML